MGSINIGPRDPLHFVLSGELFVLLFPAAIWARLLDLDPRLRFWLSCVLLGGAHAFCWESIDCVRSYEGARGGRFASSRRWRPVGGVHLAITLSFDIAVCLSSPNKRGNIPDFLCLSSWPSASCSKQISPTSDPSSLGRFSIMGFGCVTANDR
jgi:hypothetical protein